MKQRKSLLVFLIVMGAALCLNISIGHWTAATAAPEEFACAPEGSINKQICPEAQLAQFSCFFKKFEGAQTLHFKLAVKNVSDKPQRYRVRIFLDNGKAVGGLIPRKTKKGLVKPGQTATFVYPVGRMPDKPGSIDLFVTTVGR